MYSSKYIVGHDLLPVELKFLNKLKNSVFIKLSPPTISHATIPPQTTKFP